jgi:hypothetical protein
MTAHQRFAAEDQYKQSSMSVFIYLLSISISDSDGRGSRLHHVAAGLPWPELVFAIPITPRFFPDFFLVNVISASDLSHHRCALSYMQLRRLCLRPCASFEVSARVC